MSDLAPAPAPVPGVPVEIAPGVIRLTASNPGPMTGPGTNTYLVGTASVTVVDPGPDDPAHVDRIVLASPGPIGSIAVTHTHLDHSPAAKALSERTGAPRVGFSARDGFEPDITAPDGYRIDLGELGGLRALHTPGHASNHLCWLLEDAGILFSGDHVMQGSTVVIAPLDGDMDDYLANLRRLRELGDDLRAIAPGHGSRIDDPHDVLDGYIAHRLAREAAVVTALAEAGEATIDELVPTVYADVIPALHPMARLSLWAHLRRMIRDGRATALDPADPLTRWRTASS